MRGCKNENEKGYCGGKNMNNSCWVEINEIF